MAGTEGPSADPSRETDVAVSVTLRDTEHASVSSPDQGQEALLEHGSTSQRTTAASTEAGAGAQRGRRPPCAGRAEWSVRNLCVALLCFGAPMALLVATLVRVNGGGGGEWEGLGVDDFVLDPPEHVRRPRVAWAADSGSLMAVERVGGAASPSLFAVDAESGARALLLAPADVVNATDGAPVDYDDVVARSPDGGAALLRNGVQSHWRHSTVAHYFVVQLRDDAPNAPAAPTAAISVASGVQHAVWRPRQPASRRSLAYVAGNDVHIAVVAGSEVEVQRVTTDGSDTRVNGVPDWLDEEEVFESEVAMWWSDDGSRLAFASFDLADVPVFSIPRYEGGAYTAQMDVRYPSPGYPNPVASLWVVAEGRSPVEVDLGADGFGAGRYVHAVQWAAQGDAQRLLVRTLNRAQTRDCLLEVLFTDRAAPTSHAAPRVLRSRSVEDGWIEPSRRVLPVTLDGERFLIDVETNAEGRAHLALLSDAPAQPSTLQRWLTAGQWDVRELLGVDSARGVAFVHSTALDAALRDAGALEQLVTEVDLTATSPESSVRAVSPPGWHHASVSPDGAALLLASAGPAVPSTSLRRPAGCGERAPDAARGCVVATLEDNAALQASLPPDMPSPQFTTVTAADGATPLNAWLLFPHPYTLEDPPPDPLPLLMYVYGGPGSQTVTRAWMAAGTRGRFHLSLASRGVIVASVDGRGTGGRGRAFLTSTYRKLGVLETEDQLAAARFFAQQPYVDASRVGLWGWSYGGYMAARSFWSQAAAASPLRCAMSVAPVSDWRFYDSAYTERYMGTPADNAAGYEVSSVLPFAADAARFGGDADGRYLLAAGTGDDNVHFANTMELTKALVASGVQFETMVYPNQAHALSGGGAQTHVWRLLDGFVQRKLQREDDDDDKNDNDDNEKEEASGDSEARDA